MSFVSLYRPHNKLDSFQTGLSFVTFKGLQRTLDNTDIFIALIILVGPYSYGWTAQDSVDLASEKYFSFNFSYFGVNSETTAIKTSLSLKISSMETVSIMILAQVIEGKES